MDIPSKKDSLTSLNLSVRSQNALKAYGITTIEDLVNLPKFELLKIPNLGSISILEISRILEPILAEKTLTIDDHISFMDKEGILHADIHLDQTCLSSRCCNRLKSANILTVKDLMDTSLYDLKAIPYLGKTCIDEIEQLEDSLEVLILHRHKGEAWTPNHICNEFVYYVNEALGQTSYDFYMDLLNLCQRFFDHRPQKSFPRDIFRNKAFLSRLYRLDSYLDVIDRHILRNLKKNKDGLTLEDLVALMPRLTGIGSLVQDRLALLEKNNFITSKGQVYFSLYPSILQILRDYFEPREASVYQMRMQEATLQEIGDKFDLSRERVRQILLSMNRFMKDKQIYTSEDYYRPYIQNYALDRTSFENIFEEKLAYGYIDTRYGLGTRAKPLEDLIMERGLSNLARNKLKSFLSKRMLFLKKGYIERDRQAIIHYLLKNYATWQQSFDEFYCLYQEFIKSYQLMDDPSINITKHNLMNKLAMDDFVLWSFGRTLRYYPFDSYDFSRLLKNLALDSYQDVEFSSRYFFTRYPSLMKAYDLKDEYELHNLLRKIYNPKDYPQIKFLRMPNIQIGKGNRQDQVLGLLRDHSPISLHDLASLYEKTYGVHHNSVVSSYLKCIEDYHYKGIYDINHKAMPESLVLDFKAHLGKDFYFNDDLVTLFKKYYPQLDPSLMNPRSSRQLGFKVFQDYSISEKFQFAQDCFRQILLKKPMYPMDIYPKRFWNLSNVLTCFYALKKDLFLFQYDKKTLITYKYLQALDVNREDLLDFRQSVRDFVEDLDYFTLTYLRNLGHDHKLYHMGLRTSFLEGLLAEDSDNFFCDLWGQEMVFSCKARDLVLEGFLDHVKSQAEDPKSNHSLNQALESYGLKNEDH